jgi:hypothetical protein
MSAPFGGGFHLCKSGTRRAHNIVCFGEANDIFLELRCWKLVIPKKLCLTGHTDVSPHFHVTFSGPYKCSAAVPRNISGPSKCFAAGLRTNSKAKWLNIERGGHQTIFREAFSVHGNGSRNKFGVLNWYATPPRNIFATRNVQRNISVLRKCFAKHCLVAAPLHV